MNSISEKMMNEKINSLIDQVKTLEGIIEQMQALINFQQYQHNSMVDIGVRREKEMIRLERKLAKQHNEGF